MNTHRPWSLLLKATRQAFQWLLLSLVLSAPGVSVAQVVTNITSSGLNTSVTHASNTNTWNITGGTRPGNGPNLFQSFGNFSVGTGDVANFLNTTPNLTTSNILGRVTGGNVSNIYGTLQTTGFNNANLYLMNPSGIVLGPSASLNVGGSVSFTTAQYIRLFDALGASANFYANPANDGLANSILAIDASAFEFLSAQPAAYGFLTAPDPNATITVNGSALSVPSGQSISLVGGKVVIEGGAQLSAPGGRIQLATAASPGEFAAPPGQSLSDVATSLQPSPNTDLVSFAAFGSASLAPGSTIAVSGTHTVFIRGGQLVLSVNDAVLNTSESPAAPTDTISLGPGSSIVTSNSGPEAGAEMQITVGTLNLDGSRIATETFGDGGGGSITLNVGTLSLTNMAELSSNNSSPGSGQGGNLTVQGLPGAGSPANAVTLDTLSVIKTETFGPGRGGDLTITTLTMQMDNQSEVRTGTFFGGGVGGDLTLNVGSLSLNGGSTIRTTDFTFATDVDFDGVPDIPSTGAAGHVTIQGSQGGGTAAGSVGLSGGSQIVSESLDGTGGRLSLTTTSLNLNGSSSINSGTFGFGRGGDIVLNVGNASLSGGSTIASRPVQFNPIAGEPGNITIQGLNGNGSKADALTMTGPQSGIVQDTYGTANAGDITVHAKTVSLTDQAVIEGGTTQGEGTGGQVSIDANSVSITSGSHISSQARAQDAGQVTITADQLIMDNGSIETSTSSTIGGRGGSVLLNVGTVSLSNGAAINSSTSQTGPAGNITMNVGTLNLNSGSRISSASTQTSAITNLDGTTEPPGRAGNVTINATGGFASDASQVKTSAEANHGGDISISAQNVQLSNGTVINASSNAPLQVTKLVLDGNGQLVEQVVGDGNAGSITINSASNFIMQNSSMTTAAAHASGGQITVHAPDTVQLMNSNIVTSVQGGSTDTTGGNISIDPQSVILQDSQVLAQANAGTGGNISITAGVFLADPNSTVDASSTLGVSGTVDIRSPVSNISGVIGRLPESVLAAQTILRSACAGRLAEGKLSSFVERQRDHIPIGPEGLLATPYVRPSVEPSIGTSPGQLSLGGSSEIQVRRLMGRELTPPVVLLSGGTACHS